MPALRHASIPTAQHSCLGAIPQCCVIPRRLYLGDNFMLGNPDSVSYNPVQSEVVDLAIIR